MLLVWMIIGRMVMMVMMMIKGRVMMLMTLTRNLNDGMELIGQPVV